MAPEIRELLEMTLADFGITGLENWHYYISAAILAILTVTYEISRLITARIIPIKLRYISDENKYYLKLQIWNRSKINCMVMVQLRLMDENNEPFSINSRDSFILLTQQRAAERKQLEEYNADLRRRFHLNANEKKDIELLWIGNKLTDAICCEELGEINIPIKNYIMEIEINGGASPWYGKIKMALEKSAITFDPLFLKDSSLCLNKVINNESRQASKP